MSEFFNKKFNEHSVHQFLENNIALASSELNNADIEAKPILKNILKIFFALKEAIGHMDSEIAIRNGTLDRIQNVVHSLTVSEFEYYKAHRNINDLIRVNNYFCESLKKLLNHADNTTEKNIKNSLKKLYAIAEEVPYTIIETDPADIGFAEKLREQGERVEKSLNETEEKIKQLDDKLEGAANKEFDNVVKKFNARLSNYREEAEKEREKLQELHGIVAGEGFTSGYAKLAKKEESKATVWRYFSVAFILALVGFAVYAANIPVAKDINSFIGQIIKTFSVAGALIYTSVFAIRQSNQHRKNANRAMWLAMGMNAIGAFTGKWDTNDKKEAGIKMVDAILSQQEGEGNAESNSTSKDEIMERLKIITDLIQLKKPN